MDTDTYDRQKGGTIEKVIPKWSFEGVKQPSESQRRRMIALALSITVKNILENHLYVFSMELYRWLTGGPIGDNITMIAAELVIYEFQLGYRDMVTKLSLDQHILFMKIYIDDLNQVYRSLPYGSKYQKR